MVTQKAGRVLEIKQLFFFFFERVLLWSPDAGLELTEVCLPLPPECWVLGLKG